MSLVRTMPLHYNTISSFMLRCHKLHGRAVRAHQRALLPVALRGCLVNEIAGKGSQANKNIDVMFCVCVCSHLYRWPLWKTLACKCFLTTAPGMRLLIVSSSGQVKAELASGGVWGPPDGSNDSPLLTRALWNRQPRPPSFTASAELMSRVGSGGWGGGDQGQLKLPRFAVLSVTRPLSLNKHTLDGCKSLLNFHSSGKVNSDFFLPVF